MRGFNWLYHLWLTETAVQGAARSERSRDCMLQSDWFHGPQWSDDDDESFNVYITAFIYRTYDPSYRDLHKKLNMLVFWFLR